MKVIGVKRLHGVSIKGPYDFAELFCCSKLETGKFGGATIEGGGEEMIAMECDPAAVVQFEGLTFPCEITLKTESRPVRGEWKAVCIGVDRAAVVASKAVKGAQQ